MEILFEIIYYSPYATNVLLAIALLAVVPRIKSLDISNKILYFFLVLLLLNDISSSLFAYYFSSNLLFISTCGIIELVCIYLFFRSISTHTKKIYDVLFLLLLIFNIYEFITIDFYNFSQLQLYSRSINNIFLLLIVIQKIIGNLKNVQQNKWIKIKLLFAFFLAVSIVVSLPLNILINNKSILVYLIWFINMINYIILNVVIIHHLWKVKPQIKV